MSELGAPVAPRPGLAAALASGPAGGPQSGAAAGRPQGTTAAPISIGLVAGESSGDQLGAALISALKALVPQVSCFGVGGPKMAAAGFEAWASSEELAVMGFTEPLRHLPRLLRLRSMLIERFGAARPDAFVGIDAPAFNLGLAKRLKRQGMRTVQYVSPQVWAWRQGRVRSIGAACDLVLCLLPFETEFYVRHGVRALFVGHPLADQIPLSPDRAAARAALALDAQRQLIALLPGSRLAEVERLGSDFAAAASWLRARRPEFQFVAPMASARVRAVFERQLARTARRPEILLLDGHAHTALAAADAAIVASGTATLETLLSGRPMVVAYRVSALTALLLRTLGLVKVPYFSQPNLLIGRARVPEFFQEQVSAEALGAALLRELEDPAHVEELRREFRAVHEALRLGGAQRAAAAILECARERR
ncbi:MAG TPA: lipid-A-disaccharide synthase [Steroidobacteraceae bacterium]|nr:lipid-A-disaccharide synthase [Steroidobacteraceae bacterium]